MTRFAPIAVALISLAAAQAAPPLKPGAQAPEVIFKAADGAPVALSSFKGKVVLVDFWASWCGPCKVSFPIIDGLYRDLAPRGFQVLAVNVDEKRRDADRFLAGRAHDMLVLFDPEGKGPAAFGVAGMPTSYLLGRDLRVRFVHEGYTGKTVDSYRREIEQLLSESGDKGDS